MNNISFQIEYDAFPSDFKLEDFEGIENFKKELSEEYVSNVKATPVGRGGFAYELIINSILNISLEDFILMIAGGLAWDTIKFGTKKLLLKPFLKSFDRLNELNNNGISIREFRMKFDDSEVVIKSVNEAGVYKIVPLIFEQLVKVYRNLKHPRTNFFPAQIYVPIIFDSTILNGEEIGFRLPAGEEEYLEKFDDLSYFTHWGLLYEYLDEYSVYDVKNETILEKEFVNEYFFLNYILPEVFKDSTDD